ncbi:integrase [Methylobacterium sp. J-070]|uniref:integrase n=1 Tax=Methylobacterium sp. J-070 TaxID=2836650 RepID=UPI001FB8E386|nr:site-specific integrase [Methylobacterium sp. J-070]MCJ2054469.1 site-specific integrase [Methylobacterium sp. J-070]
MATLRKRNDKWQAQVRRVGTPPISRTFTLKADAQAWARQMELQAERGDLPAKVTSIPPVTLGAIVARYRDEVTPRKRSGKNEAIVLTAFLRHQLATVQLDSLTAERFAAYRDERLGKVKAGSVRRELAVLRHCLEIAIGEWGINLPNNPIKLVKLPNEAKPRDRRLLAGDSERISEALNSPSAWYLRPFITLAVETGMRRGELLSVVWKDVELTTRTMRVSRTKNGHPRTVPLSPVAVETLTGMERTGDRIFPVTANAVRLAWQRARKRAGLSGLRFHDLRHEAVSRLFEAGLSVPEVAMVSGHRTPAMLFRYTHPRAEAVAMKLAQARIAGDN